MRRVACTIVALALGAACGPTKPGEVPPLAPRPDPGGPVAPSPIPGVPDPDRSPLPGPSPEPTIPVGKVPARNQPVDRQSTGPEPISYEFRAAGTADRLGSGHQPRSVLHPPAPPDRLGSGSPDGRAEPVTR